MTPSTMPANRHPFALASGLPVGVPPSDEPEDDCDDAAYEREQRQDRDERRRTSAGHVGEGAQEAPGRRRRAFLGTRLVVRRGPAGACGDVQVTTTVGGRGIAVMSRSPRPWAFGLATMAGLLMLVQPSTAWAAKAKPIPPADESAQGACQQVRLMDVNDTYGLAASQSDYALLAQLLQESKSQGAPKLAKALLKAPLPAAQTVAPARCGTGVSTRSRFGAAPCSVSTGTGSQTSRRRSEAQRAPHGAITQGLGYRAV